jgi:excisionase family DNA binding protein
MNHHSSGVNMQTISVKPRLLTTEQAAEFLGVSAGTLVIWRFHARYRLPFVKIGRNVRYDENDLREWLESRKVHQVEAHA